MSESDWVRQGATLSHNNACKEFGLTEDEVFGAMKAGKLQYRRNAAHGNPYYKLLRAEVTALALELRGASYLEDRQLANKLKAINSEMTSLKRKLTVLEKQKNNLIEIQKQMKS